MQTMQNFYEQLFSDATEDDGYAQALAELTQAQPEELAALDSAVTWTDWGAAD